MNNNELKLSLERAEYKLNIYVDNELVHYTIDEQEKILELVRNLIYEKYKKTEYPVLGSFYVYIKFFTNDNNINFSSIDIIQQIQNVFGLSKEIISLLNKGEK
jgi:DNA helicase HerA-like ATPase